MSGPAIIIVEAGGKKVSSISDVHDAIKSAQDRGTRSVLLRVKTGENTHFVAVPVSKS